LNILGRSLAIQRQDPEFPLNGSRGWRVANLLVACLILELAMDRDRLSFLAQRAYELRGGSQLSFLCNAERSLEDRYSLLNGWEVESLRSGVGYRQQLDLRSWLDRQADRPIASHSRGIHMNILGKPHFHREADAVPGKRSAIGLLDGQAQMRRLDGVGDFFSQFRK